ncbi:hypothetical protein ACPZ19_22970 [Amycolatopsis lurida]|uniref:hypothetical protein n=1 Tax=Amycolatopsis sp. YIM 10 TaxID=2653857 RepID=UPI00128FEAAC|nr:hypothetical protein [Amycolatopsis sp. YIM 10]QFU87498.1 hypothetical protein YIM_11480 [Amycolatopsis sp. YIM 10]
MRVRQAPGVSVILLPDGRLALTSRLADSTFECAPPIAAMWIALRQHDGDCDAAAAMLAVLWQADPVHLRADMEVWIDELVDAGLLIVSH